MPPRFVFNPSKPSSSFTNQDIMEMQLQRVSAEGIIAILRDRSGISIEEYQKKLTPIYNALAKSINESDISLLEFMMFASLVVLDVHKNFREAEDNLKQLKESINETFPGFTPGIPESPYIDPDQEDYYEGNGTGRT